MVKLVKPWRRGDRDGKGNLRNKDLAYVLFYIIVVDRPAITLLDFRWERASGLRGSVILRRTHESAPLNTREDLSMTPTYGESALDEACELALTAVTEYDPAASAPLGGYRFDDSYDDYEDDDFEEEEDFDDVDEDGFDNADEDDDFEDEDDDFEDEDDDFDDGDSDEEEEDFDYEDDIEYDDFDE